MTKQKKVNGFTKIFRLAFRNLTRQKRRNVILAIAIGFGFFIVTSIDGLTSGAVGNLEDTITQLTGGTVIISGYEKEKVSEDLDKYRLVNIIRDKDYIQTVLERSEADYRYYSKYTSSSGQLVFAGNKALSNIVGRDYTNDPNLIESFRIAKGNIEDIYAPDALVISQGLADTLNLDIGDDVTYTTTTIYGQNNVADFRIAAIIEDNTFISSMMCYANIETVNKIIDIPEGGYSSFTVFLKKKNQQSLIANRMEEIIRQDGYNVSSRIEAMQTNPSNVSTGISKQFNKKDIVWDGVKYSVSTLQDNIPAIQTVLTVVHTVTTVILIVILLIVMVGISNTYRMVLYERIREIGTMRALGMSGKDTGRVFTTEAVILSVIGACAGIIVSVIVMVILGFIPISDMSVSMFLHNGHMTFSLSPLSIIIQYILMIVLTALAVKGTARNAANMSPAQALRTVK